MAISALVGPRIIQLVIDTYHTVASRRQSVLCTVCLPPVARLQFPLVPNRTCCNSL